MRLDGVIFLHGSARRRRETLYEGLVCRRSTVASRSGGVILMAMFETIETQLAAAADKLNYLRRFL